MDKQQTIAFVLIGIILVVWLYINAPEPQTQDTKPKADSTQVEQKPAEQQKEIVEEQPVKTDTVQTVQPLQGNVEQNEQIITIETDLALYEMTSKGARFRKCFLKKYEVWYHNDLPDTASFYDKHVQLINDKDGGDFNLIFVTKNGQLVNTKDLFFESSADNYYYKITDGDSLVLTYTFDTGNGNRIIKRFIIHANDYAVKADVEFENMNEVITGYRYDVEWQNGINFLEENSVEEATYANSSAFSGDEQVIVDASAGEKVEKTINGVVDWVAVRNKYFAVIVAPDNPQTVDGADLKGEHILTKMGEREFYSVSLKVLFDERKPNQKNSYEVYLGPLDYYILKDHNKNFEAIYDFGSFFGLKFITRPISEFILLPLFTFLHKFIPNYGWVIIIFSLIIKIVLYPLTRQSYKSMRKMQLLQPKIKEIKEKYKDDQQKVQKETMKLYSTYGINPAGGCLPTLLQMPILFALFTFFRTVIELRHEPFIGWITNLAAPDVIYTLPFKIPLFGINQISGLAILLGVTMFFQQKMSVKDPSQKALVYIMPVMLTFLFMTFPSGLNLYYFMFNLFSIGQQYLINSQKDGAELVPVKNPKKKSGFMQRMMEAAEQQQKAQQKKRKR